MTADTITDPTAALAVNSGFSKAPPFQRTATISRDDGTVGGVGMSIIKGKRIFCDDALKMFDYRDYLIDILCNLMFHTLAQWRGTPHQEGNES